LESIGHYVSIRLANYSGIILFPVFFQGFSGKIRDSRIPAGLRGFPQGLRGARQALRASRKGSGLPAGLPAGLRFARQGSRASRRAQGLPGRGSGLPAGLRASRRAQGLPGRLHSVDSLNSSTDVTLHTLARSWHCLLIMHTALALASCSFSASTIRIH